LIVTVCVRHSVNSSREEDVNVADVTAPVLVNVIDIDPPSAHGIVVVRDGPSGETVIAVFIAAWFTAAPTMLCVVEVPGLEGGACVNGEGADGPCPPQPPRRPRTMRNAPEEHARIGGILPDRRRINPDQVCRALSAANGPPPGPVGMLVADRAGL
jgi:hypothetical protein